MNEIDVSGCEFYCEKYDGCYCFNSSDEVYAVNPNEHNSCEAIKDCYYKKLQQLKTENEELKKQKEKYKNGEMVYFTDYMGTVWHSDKIVQQLKAENEKLRFPREDIDFAVLTKEEFENYNKLKAENSTLKDETICLRAEIEKQKERYKQYINSKQASYEEFQRRWQEEKARADELQAELDSFMNGDYCSDGCAKMKKVFGQRYTHQSERLSKYKAVLDDIEEIINNFAKEDIITLPDLSMEKNYKLIAEQYAEPIKQIIEKINEVK